MPFTAGPHQMLNYQMTREYQHQAALRGTIGLRWNVSDAYGHPGAAYGQPYVAMQQPQQQPHPQQQQPPPQPPQQQAGPPPRGHPIPSPSPVNSGMVIQVGHETGPNKVAPAAVVPNVAAIPFKPREKKMALLQDPTTMEVVDLVKTVAGDPSSQSSASTTRSTPSADSVKADAASTTEPAVPEPAKTLPNVSNYSSV